MQNHKGSISENLQYWVLTSRRIHPLQGFPHCANFFGFLDKPHLSKIHCTKPAVINDYQEIQTNPKDDFFET